MSETRIEELRRRLDKEPGSRLFAQLAEELRKASELDEAIRVSRDGLQKYPTYHSARLTLARALFDTGALALARPEFEAVLGSAPDNILASRLLAETLEGLGDLAAARDRFASTLALAPDDKQVQARLSAVEARLAPAPARRPEPPRVPEVSAPWAAAEPPPIPLVAAEEDFELESPYESAATRVGQPGGGGEVGPDEFTAAPAAGFSEVDQEFVDFEAETLSAQPAPVEIVSRVPLEEEWPAAPDEAPGSVPEAPSGELASATLAELYASQGHTAGAIDVYRQLLEREPANEPARARLIELQKAAGASPPEASSAAVASGDRRLAVERTITRLEGMLAALRRG